MEQVHALSVDVTAGRLDRATAIQQITELMDVTEAGAASLLKQAEQKCGCKTGPDGVKDTDGCRIHDMPLSGWLIGWENQ